MDNSRLVQVLDRLTSAVERISFGEKTPSGTEAIVMSLTGNEAPNGGVPVSAALNRIADVLSDGLGGVIAELDIVATQIQGLQDTLRGHAEAVLASQEKNELPKQKHLDNYQYLTSEDPEAVAEAQARGRKRDEKAPK